MRTLRRDHGHKDADLDSEGTWAISYGDMVTLLLAFFILFFSVDSKKDQATALQQALIEILEPMQERDKPAGRKNQLDAGSLKEKGIDKDVIKSWSGKAHIIGERILIEFPSVSFFRSGETDVTRSGEDSLKKFVEVFIPYASQYFVGVRAYTDLKPVVQKKGRRFRDNLELSALRSVSTVRVLQRSGIPLDRIRVGGYGELRLAAEDLARVPASERSQASLDLARRVVLVLEPGGRPNEIEK